MSEKRETEEVILSQTTDIELDVDTTVKVVSGMVMGVIGPVLEQLTKLLENNTQAMDQIAGAQQIANNRLEALEKQVRLNTPVTKAQENLLNAAMKQKAREVLDKRGYADDRKAVTKLTTSIRKSVFIRYGISGLRDLPRHEYSVAMSQINMWNDALVVRDVCREARERAGEQDDKR